MGKILAIVGCIFIAVVLGFVFSFMIGPVQFDNTLLGVIIGDVNETFQKPTDENESIVLSVQEIEAETPVTSVSQRVIETQPDDEPDDSEIEPLPKMAGHPLVGRWEVTELVEVAAHHIDEIGVLFDFFENGTGIEHFTEEPISREMKWDAEGGRLTITPNDASYRIRTYDYEINRNVLSVFFNINRTSFFEATKVAR